MIHFWRFDRLHCVWVWVTAPRSVWAALPHLIFIGACSGTTLAALLPPSTLAYLPSPWLYLPSPMAYLTSLQPNIGSIPSHDVPEPASWLIFVTAIFAAIASLWKFRK